MVQGPKKDVLPKKKRQLPRSSWATQQHLDSVPLARMQWLVVPSPFCEVCCPPPLLQHLMHPQLRNQPQLKIAPANKNHAMELMGLGALATVSSLRSKHLELLPSLVWRQWPCARAPFAAAHSPLSPPASFGIAKCSACNLPILLSSSTSSSKSTFLTPTALKCEISINDLINVFKICQQPRKVDLYNPISIAIHSY